MTATAKKLAEWDENGTDPLNYIAEALYRKKTGEFFVFGDGGANTKYARIGRLKVFEPGSAILPMSLEQAKEWALDRLPKNEYDDIFGDMIDDDGSTTFPSMWNEIVCLTTDGQGRINRLLTDEGKSYMVTNSINGRTPNVAYRMMCGYTVEAISSPPMASAMRVSLLRICWLSAC